VATQPGEQLERMRVAPTAGGNARGVGVLLVRGVGAARQRIMPARGLGRDAGGPLDSEAVASVKLHRCSWTFIHHDVDACWKVQRALDEQGIDYEIVKHGWIRGERPAVRELSGQKLLPVIEFEDGRSYRAESAEMAERVRAGQLFD
jgi:hypothetical protein